jgi:hypothetical protein
MLFVLRFEGCGEAAYDVEELWTFADYRETFCTCAIRRIEAKADERNSS